MQKHILPLCGSMRLTEFSPKVVAAFYGELQKQPNITPHILAAIQKLLHSAFEQAVLWEYVDRNPFHKAEIPKPFSNKLPLLSKEEMKKLLQNCGFSTLGIAVHLAFAGSLRKGEILALENGKLVATGTDITKTTYRLARSMCKKDTSFITVISGCDVSEEDAARTAQLVQAKCPSGIEVTQLAGGQPVYYYIISVE